MRQTETGNRRRAFFPFALQLDYMCGAVPVKDALRHAYACP